jgi:hypothetical protein
MKTDHTKYIEALRAHGGNIADLCADLLEMHDATAISLDDWESAKHAVSETLAWIEADAGYSLQPNGA